MHDKRKQKLIASGAESLADALLELAVYDYLEEVHGQLPCSEKSLRNYISFLLQCGHLVFQNSIRPY